MDTGRNREVHISKLLVFRAAGTVTKRGVGTYSIKDYDAETPRAVPFLFWSSRDSILSLRAPGQRNDRATSNGTDARERNRAIIP